MMENSAWVVFRSTIQFMADLAYWGAVSSCQHSITEYPLREASAVIFNGVVIVVVASVVF